jgi:F-type H+-transporting ATPase subunit delta
MIKLARRKVARFALDEIGRGTQPKKVASALAAELVETKRINEAKLLISDIAELAENDGQSAQVVVSSAHELKNRQLEEIGDILKKQLGVSSVVVENRVDKNLIGGLKIDTATRSIDKSVARQLNIIKEQI